MQFERQRKSWTFRIAHFVSKKIVEQLRQRIIGEGLKFVVSTGSVEKINHHSDHYFYLVNMNVSKETYPGPDSAKKPVLHSGEIPIASTYSTYYLISV